MQVFVAPRAERHFDTIMDFIREKWGEQTAKQFLIKTDEIFRLLSSYPTMGSVEKDDIRGFQLSKHTRMLYRIRKDKIIVLSFFDVRQNPNKKFG